MTDELRRVSKFLSYVLRHRPDSIGVELDEHGWIAISELLAAAKASGRELTRELIAEVVRSNDKQRFRLSDDRERIRANQGHSVAVDLELPARTPPPVLYHGTADRYLESIRATGLQKQSRQHVHLSADPKTATNVGSRHGRPVVLRIDAAAMHTQGHTFHCSDNGVWLTEHVPPGFLEPA